MDDRRSGIIALAAGCTLAFAVAMAAPAFSAIPDHGQGQGNAKQLPSGGQVEADVNLIEGATGSNDNGNNDAAFRGPGATNEGSMKESKGLITHHWAPTGTGCWYGEAGGESVDGSPDGEIYERIRVDPTTDPPTETVTYGDCFESSDLPASPPPPPSPPTLAEITALARELIIAPAVQISPDADVGGITGLDTWFWYDGQDTANVSVGLRGYTVTASMAPSRYYWDPGDPRAGILESGRPGSEQDPAATWVYETKDNYEVRVQVVWDGTWSFTGHGASASGDLPTIRATGLTDYRVDEVRSELTGAR